MSDLSSGFCKACNKRAMTNNDNHSSNTERDAAFCIGSQQYIWTCDKCGRSFHYPQKFPTASTLYCPNCGSHEVYNQNKGIDFD